MLIDTKFSIGEVVEIISSDKLQGTISNIRIIIEDKDVIEFSYLVTFDNLDAHEKFKDKLFFFSDLKKISTDVPQSLSDILTTGLTLKEEIAANLAKAIKHRKQLEEAEIKLKSMLQLKTGEVYNDDDITVTCYLKKTIDYVGNSEYDKALSDLESIKEFLKLSKKTVEKESIITTAKLKK